ncbi:XkdX family protein [Clostridium felsineum]|uniref:XkdX family protein n=1 Tax=Clostridium felsineum TaxID=36839 RepID=UPI00098CAA0B|nr:XkdX family protein [Clostridium felsineum]URZ15811.1 hypothetical protein CLFE_018580 [Clostridium felsineum DSM 794]
MHSNNFDFYDVFYSLGFFTINQVQEACKWSVINQSEFKEITGQEYTSNTQ